MVFFNLNSFSLDIYIFIYKHFLAIKRINIGNEFMAEIFNFYYIMWKMIFVQTWVCRIWSFFSPIYKVVQKICKIHEYTFKFLEQVSVFYFGKK